MSTPSATPQPTQPVERPESTGKLAVLNGIVLGVALSFPVVIAPFLLLLFPLILAGWIYLMLRILRKNDILTDLFTAPHHREIALRAIGIALTAPVAGFIAAPTSFFLAILAASLFDGFPESLVSFLPVLTFLILMAGLWYALGAIVDRFTVRFIQKSGSQSAG